MAKVEVKKEVKEEEEDEWRSTFNSGFDRMMNLVQSLRPKLEGRERQSGAERRRREEEETIRINKERLRMEEEEERRRRVLEKDLDLSSEEEGEDSLDEVVYTVNTNTPPEAAAANDFVIRPSSEVVASSGVLDGLLCTDAPECLSSSSSSNTIVDDIDIDEYIQHFDDKKLIELVNDL